LVLFFKNHIQREIIIIVLEATEDLTLLGSLSITGKP